MCRRFYLQALTPQPLPVAASGPLRCCGCRLRQGGGRGYADGVAAGMIGSFLMVSVCLCFQLVLDLAAAAPFCA